MLFHSSTNQTDGDSETVGVQDRGESYGEKERSERDGI